MLGKAHEQTKEPDKFQLRMGLDPQIPKIVTIDAFTRQEPRDFPQFDSPLEFPTL